MISSNLNANPNIPSVINYRFEKAKKHIYPLLIVLFISVSIVVGVLVICLTSKPSIILCGKTTFERPRKSSLVSSSQPRSVAIADFNNDHRSDIVIANYGTNTIRILISQGDDQFNEQETYSTGFNSLPCSITIADFNNDQNFDIAVANYGLNNIRIFLGLGNGSFLDFTTISLGPSRPMFITIGDFNHDNQIDIAVVNNGTDSFGILLGYGNASFQNYQIYSTGYDSFPCSLVVGHFNNDSHLDIAVANSRTNNIGIFLGIGNGSFLEQFVYLTGVGSNPSSISTGDFNSDHHLDIVVSNYARGTIGIFFGHGNGTFQQQQTYLIGFNSRPQYLIVDNLNIMIVDSVNDQIHIYRGFGNGSFDVLTTYDGISQSQPWCIAFADLNKNNQTDLIVTNSGINNILILMDYFVIQSARKTILLSKPLTSPTSVVIADLNNDSILDIISGLEGFVYIFIGLKNGSFVTNTLYSADNVITSQYISVGDVNNDNKTDIIIADTSANCVDIFLNEGNGNFSKMKTYSTGMNSVPYGLALGDFNHDNALDIVTANYISQSIGILFGYGNGSFAPVINYSMQSNNSPLSVAVGYIDGDHHLDFAVCDRGNRITIFLGFGNGSFYIATMFDAGGTDFLFSIALADLNSDTYLDIVVTDTMGYRITIFLGYGNANFERIGNYSTGVNSQPYYAIIHDFNHDYINDIAVSNFNTNEILIFYGYGNGSFELTRNFSTDDGSVPYGIAAADFNNDKQLEIVIAFWGSGKIVMLTEYSAAKFHSTKTYSTGSAPRPYSVAINQSLIVTANSGTDNLNLLFISKNDSFDYSTGKNSQPKSVIICDINNDQQLDILSVNSKSDSISVHQTFQDQIEYSTGDRSQPFAIVSSDLNNDTYLDLIVANEGTDEIGLFYGFNYSTFQPFISYSNDDNFGPLGIVVNDFNNDNYSDIAATFSDSHSIGILLGYGNGSFSNMTTYSTGIGSTPAYLGVGDFNNDKKIDLAVTMYGTNNIGIFLGYGNGSFGNLMTYSTGENGNPQGILISDLNHDNQLDIVVANSASNTIGILLGDENGSFSNVELYSTGDNSIPVSIAIGDMNNDNQLDIIVANLRSDSIGIFFGYGNGTFQSQIQISTDRFSYPQWISVDDFNRDNHLDIAVVLYNGNKLGILLGPVNGGSSANLSYYFIGAGSVPMFVCTQDFNRDTYLDIAVANSGTNTFVIFFGLGDGTFLQGKPISTGVNSKPNAMALGDFNKDFRLDIAIVNYISNNIIIFLGNDINEPFGSIKTISTGTGSQPHSIAIGDCNNDGRMDIVVANYGTNNVGVFLELESMMTYSTGIHSSPYCVALADLNNDKNLDIIVTNSQSNNILIMFGIGNGSFVEMKVYSTGDRSRPYQLVIHDMNNDQRLDLVIANSGTSNILILYGLGNETFRNKELYALGYQYEPYAIAVSDLNEDGKMDMVVACYGTDHVEILLRIC